MDQRRPIPVTTLTERKRAEAARIVRAADAVADDLRLYARERGGSFIVFGSVAEQRVRYDSDFDLLVDFPPATSGDACRFAEEVCANRDLRADILEAASTKPTFVEAVRSRGVLLR